MPLQVVFPPTKICKIKLWNRKVCTLWKPTISFTRKSLFLQNTKALWPAVLFMSPTIPFTAKTNSETNTNLVSMISWRYCKHLLSVQTLEFLFHSVRKYFLRDKLSRDNMILTMIYSYHQEKEVSYHLWPSFTQYCELLGNSITKLLVSTNQVSFFYTG